MIGSLYADDSEVWHPPNGCELLAAQMDGIVTLGYCAVRFLDGAWTEVQGPLTRLQWLELAEGRSGRRLY
jgi:hypothetical protein